MEECFKMKRGFDYIKNILFALNRRKGPSLQDIIKTLDLENITKEFVLHYEVLLDYQFIQSCDSDGSIGVWEINDALAWIDAPVRLTAQGHEFIEAIRKPEIWSVIKDEFKESSIRHSSRLLEI